uniref:Glutaredoxin-like protein n=1 Tax=Leersia perrieri TaxID=77586 RepID=A0A0D9VLH6_9ORYZ
MAEALTLLPRAAAAAVRLAPSGRAASRRLLCAAAGEAASPSPSSPAARRLVLYTKPGCCLCDGLKEKLHAAFLLAGTPYSLSSVELQASRLNLLIMAERDITTNPEWEQMYQYEIPVLAKVLPDGNETSDMRNELFTFL